LKAGMKLPKLHPPDGGENNLAHPVILSENNK
jgi:hypothetical protein